MCGIVYKKSFNNNPVNEAIKALYLNQRNRGTEGFGFYLPELDRLAHNTSEKRILDLLGDKRYASTEVLFHHRFPTSTKNVQNACHPFSTKHNAGIFDQNYVLVHNGHVSNARSLKTEHEALGIDYVSTQPDGTFNDSEALLYDVALYLDGKQSELKAQGSIAFIVKDSAGTTYFARNFGSPLVYDLTSRGLTVRSQGTGIQVEANKLYTFVEKSKAFIVNDLKVPSTSYTYTAPSATQSYWWEEEDALSKLFDDETIAQYNAAYAQVGSSIARDRYSEACDLALSLGSASEAIDWMTERFTDNQTLIKDLEDAIMAGGTSKDYDNLEALYEEQDEVEADLSALYELYYEEQGRKTEARDLMEMNYDGLY